MRQRDRIEVWWAESAAGLDVDVLSKEERARVRRLRRAADREIRTASFALRRIVLAGHAGEAAPDLRFRRDCAVCGGCDHGPPRLTGDATQALRFSVSHAKGMTLLAVARDQPVGADVEATERSAGWLAIASAMHNDGDARLPPPHLWTAKEAVLKAIGTGLVVPPRDVVIRDGRAAVSIDGRTQEFHVTWAHPSPGHVLAVATTRGAELRLRRWPGAGRRDRLRRA